ncbi:GHMP kinase [Rhodocollybia butyracea]|uniref:GHMP kinase n=1 Tax=Rhodocollybia butyracea TaxID=206335 RepID=A0A9P5PE45_9AGAR|nr:GHMP kinase [Rhodocollybia butyracea]
MAVGNDEPSCIEPSASAVPLPLDAVFIIANSLVVSDKAVTAKQNYNLRVVETLAAARILARSLGIKVAKDEKVTLREVVGQLAGEVEERMECKAERLKPRNATEDGQLGVTMEEMIEMSGLSTEEFNKVYLSWVEVKATHFQLYECAKHVLSEASQVLQFRQTCLSAASQASNPFTESLSPIDVAKTLGHCDQLYQCSCDELNELTKISRDAGALGSRLTGAGWGGCTVSLVPESDVDGFIKKVSERYGPFKDLKGEALNEVIFDKKLSSGLVCINSSDSEGKIQDGRYAYNLFGSKKERLPQ